MAGLMYFLLFLKYYCCLKWNLKSFQTGKPVTDLISLWWWYPNLGIRWVFFLSGLKIQRYGRVRKIKQPPMYTLLRIGRWNFAVFGASFFFFLSCLKLKSVPLPSITPLPSRWLWCWSWCSQTLFLCFCFICIYSQQQTMYVVFKNIPAGIITHIEMCSVSVNLFHQFIYLFSAQICFQSTLLAFPSCETVSMSSIPESVCH